MCYRSCGTCLSKWQKAVRLQPDQLLTPEEAASVGCGYLHGRELLAYYTMAQTSFSLFMSVIVAMAVCMAWRIAEDELQERLAAEEWLKKEDARASELRAEVH